MLSQLMLWQSMVRRLALGSPHSKPSTAEDGLRTRPAKGASPASTSVSIVAGDTLCNAMAGLRAALRLALRRLAHHRRLFERRNCSPGVGSVITTLTTHRLQQHFSKTREFHSVVRAADSAKGQLGQAAAESRQSSPGRRESEPWSSSTDPPATPCAFHRRHM